MFQCHRLPSDIYILNLHVYISYNLGVDGSESPPTQCIIYSKHSSLYLDSSVLSLIQYEYITFLQDYISNSLRVDGSGSTPTSVIYIDKYNYTFT